MTVLGDLCAALDAAQPQSAGGIRCSTATRRRILNEVEAQGIVCLAWPTEHGLLFVGLPFIADESLGLDEFKLTDGAIEFARPSEQLGILNRLLEAASHTMPWLVPRRGVL